MNDIKPMNKKASITFITTLFLCMCLGGCGKEAEIVSKSKIEKAGLQYESAEDGTIDFEKLQAENPDIFAWIYIPGTDIDRPILQSGIADNYYENHTADGSEGASGALYIEMANLINMCDFNTIIHGKDGIDEVGKTESNLLTELHKFEEPDFFSEHKYVYLYLPDNVLTYEIFAAYDDEDSNILRRYDYTTYEGCQKYLGQLYDSRAMGKQIREGWEEVTPYHYLITLNGRIQEATQSQFVVIGALTGDAAGKIDRVILD